MLTTLHYSSTLHCDGRFSGNPLKHEVAFSEAGGSQRLVEWEGARCAVGGSKIGRARVWEHSGHEMMWEWNCGEECGGAGGWNW